MANYKKHFKEGITSHICADIAFELKTAFVWADSPEGHEFWEKVADKLHKYSKLKEEI